MKVAKQTQAVIESTDFLHTTETRRIKRPGGRNMIEVHDIKI
jgi:hypothetical protein